jgi:GNAT superfamily N-acetyltransferase
LKVPASPEFALRLEQAEAGAWLTLSEPFRREVLVDHRGLPAGTAILDDRPAPVLNRVVGLGFERPVEAETIQRIAQLYDAAGIDAVLMSVPPTARPPTLPRLLRSFGFLPVRRQAKLYRPTDEPLPLDPYARARAADESEQPSMKAMLVESGMQPEWTDVFTAGRREQGWRHYVVMEDRQVVSLASMFVRESCAWLAPGWTLPRFRRRGLQRALLAYRLAMAREEGCEWASIDVDVGWESGPGLSYRSLNRLGFNLLYVRSVYRRQRPDPETSS